MFKNESNKYFLASEDLMQEVLSWLKLIENNQKSDANAATKNKQWLDNQDVSQMLNISLRTLQNHRDNGVIPFTKLGSKIYYKASDIDSLLNSNLSR